MKKLFLLALIITILSCSKEPQNLSTFEEVIDSGGSTLTPSLSASSDTTDIQNNIEIGGGIFNCTTITYDINAASGGDSGFYRKQRC